MSAHLMKTEVDGRALEVQIGWDRPLQYFYLVVEDPGSTSDSPVYSNLDDPVCARNPRVPLEHFIKRLGELGIELPNAILEEVRRDCAGDVGNRVVEWDPAGNIRQAGTVGRRRRVVR